MKKLFILMLTIILAGYAHNFANAATFDSGNGEACLTEALSLETDGHLIPVNPGFLLDNDLLTSQLSDVNIESPSVDDSHALNLGIGPLFITGSIGTRQGTVPESSMMLLLGISLVGLAAYGGRKRFKR